MSSSELKRLLDDYQQADLDGANEAWLILAGEIEPLIFDVFVSKLHTEDGDEPLVVPSDWDDLRLVILDDLKIRLRDGDARAGTNGFLSDKDGWRTDGRLITQLASGEQNDLSTNADMLLGYPKACDYILFLTAFHIHRAANLAGDDQRSCMAAMHMCSYLRDSCLRNLIFSRRRMHPLEAEALFDDRVFPYLYFRWAGVALYGSCEGDEDDEDDDDDGSKRVPEHKPPNSSEQAIKDAFNKTKSAYQDLSREQRRLNGWEVPLATTTKDGESSRTNLTLGLSEDDGRSHTLLRQDQQEPFRELNAMETALLSAAFPEVGQAIIELEVERHRMVPLLMLGGIGSDLRRKDARRAIVNAMRDAYLQVSGIKTWHQVTHGKLRNEINRLMNSRLTSFTDKCRQLVRVSCGDLSPTLEKLLESENYLAATRDKKIGAKIFLMAHRFAIRQTDGLEPAGACPQIDWWKVKTQDCREFGRWTIIIYDRNTTQQDWEELQQTLLNRQGD